MASGPLKKPPSKQCVCCKQVQPLTQFYKNVAWKQQNYCDAYCKDCAREMCVNKDGVREYFWHLIQLLQMKVLVLRNEFEKITH